MSELDDKRVAEALGPLPLTPRTARRIGDRLRTEVDARRTMALEGALYGGFALAAVVWAIAVVMPV